VIILNFVLIWTITARKIMTCHCRRQTWRGHPQKIWIARRVSISWKQTSFLLWIFTVNQREPKFARNCHSLVPTWSSCLTTTHVLRSRWVTVLEMDSPSVETVTEMVWWICIKCDTCLAHPCHCSLAS
jgi:hypothetical protein